MKAIGKIAQLPARVREALNRRLHDGQPASVILPWLNALPEVIEVLKDRFDAEPVSEQNLSLWRNGGFQRWLEESAEIEKTKQLAEFSAELAEAAGLGISKAAKALAAGRIMARLQTAGEDIDLETLLGLTKAAKDLHAADVAEASLNLDERKAGQKDRDLALKEQAFQFRTAEAFLQWFESEEARRIATSSERKETKIGELVQLFFGTMPEGIGPEGSAGTPARPTPARPSSEEGTPACPDTSATP